MAQLYWQTIGSGDRDLVMLHGWGLNAGVWHGITDRLSPHFRLHLVDLPGYGRSQGFPAMSVEEMVATLKLQAPARALWLGWSLGGAGCQPHGPAVSGTGQWVDQRSIVALFHCH